MNTNRHTVDTHRHTSVKRRHVTSAVVAAGLTASLSLVALGPAGTAHAASRIGGVTLAPPAAAVTGEVFSAPAAATASVFAYAPPHVPLNKPAVVAKGKVRNFPTGARIRLQRRTSSGWVTVGTPRTLSGRGAFQFKVTHARTGYNSYRTQVLTNTKVLTASRTLTTHVHRFNAPSLARSTSLDRMGAAPTSARSDQLVNGSLTCLQYSTFGATNLYGPIRTAWGNSWVYWQPHYYTLASDGSWQFAGKGEILYSSTDSYGRVLGTEWTGAAAWWSLNSGNEVNAANQTWTPGLIAAYNYVSPADGWWYDHGWSTDPNSGNQYCAV
jgi:hypothetical protein